ncbi:MAG: radical SAM protein [Promethearchaeota archaeon]
MKCRVCGFECDVTSQSFGRCGGRVEYQSRVIPRSWGRVTYIAANDVANVPLFHFHPLAQVLAVGGARCNFNCPWCINYEVVREEQIRDKWKTQWEPVDVVKGAVERGLDGVHFGFNEPTLWYEFVCKTFQLARERGLLRTMKSNGYFSSRVATSFLKSGLQAINVDVKGTREACRRTLGIDLAKIFKNVKFLAESGVHVELSTTRVPGFNELGDITAIAKLVGEELGDEIPLHVRDFTPVPGYVGGDRGRATHLQVDFPTREFRAFSESLGGILKFTYFHDWPDSRENTTRCPSCGKTVLRRLYSHVVEFTPCEHATEFLVGVVGTPKDT